MIRHVASYSTANRPMLLDTTPQTPTFDDAPLAAGRTFVDPTTGIKVTTVSVSSSGAQVQIEVRAGDYMPPNVAISTPSDGSSPTLPTTVTVSATDNVGVAKVELYRAGGSGSRAGHARRNRHGRAIHVPVGQRSNWSVHPDCDGVRRLRISSVSPAVKVNATQSDTTPPTDATNFRAIDNKQTSIATAWTASTDSSVVHYQLYRGGVKAGTATSTSTSYTFTGLACGAGYTLGVAAVDAAGNESQGVSTSAWTTACSGDTQAPSMPMGPRQPRPVRRPFSLPGRHRRTTSASRSIASTATGSTISHATSTSFTDSTVSAGRTYSYSVTAYDAAWNVSGTSASVRVTTPDLGKRRFAAAQRSERSPGHGSKLVDDRARLAGVDRQHRRGQLQGLPGRRASRTDEHDELHRFRSPPAPTYAYTVAAYDAAGNTSAQSSEILAATPRRATPKLRPPRRT